MFCKKGVLKNFSKLVAKHLCQSVFFNKVAGLTCNLIKKRLWHSLFPVNFEKFLRTPSIEHLRWLLLSLFEIVYPKINDPLWDALVILDILRTEGGLKCTEWRKKIRFGSKYLQTYKYTDFLFF